MTRGQAIALEQLREVEAADRDALKILCASEPADREHVVVLISLPCREMPYAAGGLPLRDRERFTVYVPCDFPFAPPSVSATHDRFATHPHVQWGRQLCLYQSPATEWDASDGMFGFLTRLETWLRRGALDQLDATGAPLHPPAIYTRVDRLVIPRVDTPEVNEHPWLGLAHLRIASERRADVVGWSEIADDKVPADVAATVLLPGEMPWEYPVHTATLLHQLTRRGISRRVLLLLFAIAARLNREGEPLLVLLGASMRGVRGGERRQHLAAWQLDAGTAESLRLLTHKYSSNDEIRAAAERLEALVTEVLERSTVSWCGVHEDRPEIVTRRDVSTAIAWFRGKTVVLWGCGALGAPIAEHLTRAGVRRLVLRDHGQVVPGILARQPYTEDEIGAEKAGVLGDRLRRSRPYGLEVQPYAEDLLADPLDSDDWTDGADVVIDASAASPVIEKLELRRRECGRVVPVVSIVIGHRAERGLVVVAGADHTGGPADVVRRTKVETCGRAELVHFADEFWPAEPRGDVFQPEPGCSEATFVGSAADAAALAAGMLNLAAADLARNGSRTASAHLVTQPHVMVADDHARQTSMVWPPDIVTTDPHSGYAVRITAAAWRDILGWIARSRRTAGFDIETGGVLFGERDDAAGVIWVSEVLGPPPDSEASADEFICGIDGVSEANEEKRTRSRRSVQYLGMWHTHPDVEPLPSARDLAGIARLVHAERPSTPKPLLLILGTHSTAEPPQIGAFLFRRSDFEVAPGHVLTREVHVGDLPPPERPLRDVGLALSGGGSRAIAFHLGCLRALHDRGVLERVQVVSAVSGGAVIAGLYAYGGGDFNDFEHCTLELLRQGLVGSIAREAFLSPSVWTQWPGMLASGALAVGTSALRAGTGLFTASDRSSGRRTQWSQRIRRPRRRRASRTTAFARALAASVFGDARLTDPRRNGLEVVLNACELRTGTAFRFGSRESGNWRLGRLADGSLPVARAVAASAAYPALLPALDEEMRLVQREGREVTERVFLADGGVYDNFGVTCMEPGRSDKHGYNTFRPNYIICCDAGHGQSLGDVHPYWWPSRMRRSFESVFRKAHDATRRRLHDHAAQGRLSGFILPYLGQQDSHLPYIPPDLVRREEVVHYPTDFSPMPEEMIARLSLRGEQLTRLLLTRYCPEL